MQQGSQMGIQSDIANIKSHKDHSFKESINENAKEYLEKAKDLGVKAVEKSSKIVKSNPGYSMLGAIAFGFLAGSYLARRIR